MNTTRLFRASCIALVATAMSFAIRGDIMGDFERVFGLSATEVGWISGSAMQMRQQQQQWLQQWLQHGCLSRY